MKDVKFEDLNNTLTNQAPLSMLEEEALATAAAGKLKNHVAKVYFWDFDETITTIRTTLEHGASLLPEQNTKKGIVNTFKHDQNELSAIITFNQNIELVTSYVIKILGLPSETVTLGSPIIEDNYRIIPLQSPYFSYPLYIATPLADEEYRPSFDFLNSHGKKII